MSEIDGIRERVAFDWQTYSSPTIPEMDRRTLLAAYDALAAENAALRYIESRYGGITNVSDVEIIRQRDEYRAQRDALAARHEEVCASQIAATKEAEALAARLAEAEAALSLASQAIDERLSGLSGDPLQDVADAINRYFAPDSASLNMEPCPDGSRVLCVADQPEDAGK